MIRQFVITIIVTILGFQTNLLAIPNSTPSEFFVRTPDSSLQDFESAIQETSSISYVDWLLFDAKMKQLQPKLLDEALELSLTAPLQSYDKLNLALTDLRSHLLNQQGRELMVSILIKMSELQVPERMQVAALNKAQEMILAHSSLQEISNYNDLIKASSASKKAPLSSSSAQIDNRQFEVVTKKISKIKGLEDSIILLDGVPLNNQKSFTIPKGDHQWALVSNSFSLILFFGSWQSFVSRVFSPDALVNLTEGQCANARIVSDDFQLQTQARVFSLKKCFTSALANSDKSAHSGLPSGSHLTAIPKVQEDSSSLNSILIAAGVFVLAGAAYSLKDKSVSIRAPSFKR